MDNSLIGLIEKSIKGNWNETALRDKTGLSLRYKDVARKIEKMHLIFSSCQIKAGDKIALCGTTHINWGVVLLSIISYGAVVVPLIEEKDTADIQRLVNESGAKLLFTDDRVLDALSEKQLPNLCGIVLLNDFFLTVSHNDKLSQTCEHLNEYFCKKYPMNFRTSDVSYKRERPNNVLLIDNGKQLQYQTLLQALNEESEEASQSTCAKMVVDYLHQIVDGDSIYFA